METRRYATKPYFPGANISEQPDFSLQPKKRLQYGRAERASMVRPARMWLIASQTEENKLISCPSTSESLAKEPYGHSTARFASTRLKKPNENELMKTDSLSNSILELVDTRTLLVQLKWIKNLEPFITHRRSGSTCYTRYVDLYLRSHIIERARAVTFRVKLIYMEI